MDPFERHRVHRAGVHHRRVGRDVGVVGGAVHYLAVVFAATWGFVFLGETPGATETAGILAVLAGSAGASYASVTKK